MKITKTNMLILGVALFMLLFPFMLDPDSVTSWIAPILFIIAIWYWKVIMGSRINIIAKVLLLIVALFLFWVPLVLPYLMHICIFPFEFWYWLSILIGVTGLIKILKVLWRLNDEKLEDNS